MTIPQSVHTFKLDHVEAAQCIDTRVQIAHLINSTITLPAGFDQMNAVIVLENDQPVGLITSDSFCHIRPDGIVYQEETACILPTAKLLRDAKLNEACVMFLNRDLLALTAVDPIGNIIGVFWRQQLMQHCADAVLMQSLAFEPHTSMPYSTGNSPLSFDLAAWLVDARLAGKSLRSINEQQLAITVVLVGLRRPTSNGEYAAVPMRPSVLLQRDDVLIVAAGPGELNNYLIESC